MECPKCGHEFDEDIAFQDAEYAAEFEVVCIRCKEEFWVQAHVSYTYRIISEGEVNDGMQP